MRGFKHWSKQEWRVFTWDGLGVPPSFPQVWQFGNGISPCGGRPGPHPSPGRTSRSWASASRCSEPGRSRPRTRAVSAGARGGDTGRGPGSTALDPRGGDRGPASGLTRRGARLPLRGRRERSRFGGSAGRSAPLPPPPNGEAAGLPAPPDGYDPVPALLVPGLLLLRALRLHLPAQTFVEHRPETRADLPAGGPGTPSRVLERPLFGYPLLRADQGEGRRGLGRNGRERDGRESRARGAAPSMMLGPASSVP